MINTDPQPDVTGWRPARPVISFALLAVVLTAGLSFAGSVFFGNIVVPVCLFALITGLGIRGLLVSYPYDMLGLCNGVTLIRAALVALLTGAIFAPDVERWLVFSIASTAFALDGLDGWFARRYGLVSAFGARFDMESDALLGAVLALILLSGGLVGPEVLVLGFMRYGFVALSLFVPKLRGELPESLRRKTICVIQIATLILLVCPLTPAALIYPLTVGVAAMLSWSFAIDTFRLLRTPL